MAEIVVFHHVQGLTQGLRSFAYEIREGGHVVHTPDLFEGEHPATIDDGVSLVQRLGDQELSRRAEVALTQLPRDIVYAGFSWGAAIAQRFAQTRQGARGALLFESCVPIRGDWAFGPWPKGVPVQIHGMDQDPFFAQEGDLEAAREIVQTLGPDQAELYVYPGESHLFSDSSLPSYDPDAAALLVERALAFLRRLS